MRRAIRTLALTGTLAAALSSGAAPAVADDELVGILERFQRSVVPVRYTLRPLEAPPGGEGQRVEKVICGVIANDGVIVISGDPYPDLGGDPRATLVPVEFTVLGPDQAEYAAEPLGFNRELNLAYLRFRDGIPEGYETVEFGEEGSARVGEEVLILGLLPERYDYAPTFWTGRISAQVDEPRIMYALTTFVQDLSIGGLALRPDGRPMGIVAEDVLTASRQQLPSNPLTLLGSISQGPRVGYPMVFPPQLFVGDLSEPPSIEREPTRAWFGITMQPLSRPLGEYWNIENPGGIIVSSVLDSSPAEGAGLLPGDVVLEVGSTVVDAREQADLTIFRQMVEKLPMGAEVRLSVWRGGETLALGIRPGTRPRTGALAEEFEDEEFGLTVREITLDVIQGQNLPSDMQGVVISEMENAGWAQVSGLGVRDIILRVEELAVTDLGTFASAMATARDAQMTEVYFFVQRGVETLFVTVKTDW